MLDCVLVNMKWINSVKNDEAFVCIRINMPQDCHNRDQAFLKGN